MTEPPRGHTLPSLGLQLFVDCLLNACHIKWVRGLHLSPRVRVVLREIRRVIVVCPHITGQRCGRRSDKECACNYEMHGVLHNASSLSRNPRKWSSYRCCYRGPAKRVALHTREQLSRPLHDAVWFFLLHRLPRPILSFYFRFTTCVS